jgi:hypothetical protein
VQTSALLLQIVDSVLPIGEKDYPRQLQAGAMDVQSVPLLNRERRFAEPMLEN